MPFISKVERQSDYNNFSSTCPIVIDNGASYFRIGWAGESSPRVVFRNILQRPRHKLTGETVTIVGDHDPALMKYFDCTRSSIRSAFDGNVVYQFEIMESILDYGFERLGANGSEIDHPVLITECICNPVQSRIKMAELLFETYGVPSVAFGVDAVFSYKFNQNLGNCNEDGLVVCPGFSTTHVIPFMSGEPVYKGSCRTNIGGYHVTDYLKQLLSLKYPHHMSRFTWEKIEDLKMEHCYIAPNYITEARLFQKGTEEGEEKTRYWQLPWVPPTVEEPPSGEEVARKTAMKERQGQRLREMAEAKRSSRISELEKEMQGLELLLQELGQMEEDDMPLFLLDTGYLSRQEIEFALFRVRQSWTKARGEKPSPHSPLPEKYTLIDIPDTMLSPEQVKEKRKQVFLKTTSEGRQRAKQKRFEEELQREKQSQMEEEKRLENPELYLEQLRARHGELSQKVEQRKRMKKNGSHAEGGSGFFGSGGVGRGERLNAAQKERMRLLTTAAFDRGKGEDTFGASDEDWQLYKMMSKDNDEEDDGVMDEDEAELGRVTSRLQEIDGEFMGGCENGKAQAVGELGKGGSGGTREECQVVMGVERFRCPEVLFHPGIVGIEQAGVDEMTGVALRRLMTREKEEEEKEEYSERMIGSSVLLTGGSSCFPGLRERLEAGIRMIRPCGTEIVVEAASDPAMDAWRGAAVFASTHGFRQQVITRSDFYEKGEEWLRNYQLTYSLL